MASASPKLKHKKTRRSEKSANISDLSIAHVNVRGIKSKIKDLISLTKENDIDILVFSETKLSEKENRKIPGYKNHLLNRQTRAGGVAIYFKKEFNVKVVKKNKECETLWVKLKGKEQDLVIGGIYSPCEESVSKTSISNFVREVEKDLVEIRDNICKDIIMVGDFNAHVGADEEGITGNNEKTGINGQEYRRFFKERELVLCNNTSKCTGQWTRIQGETKSILDLTVCTKSTYESLTSMEIDDTDRFSIESKKAKIDHKLTLVKIKLEPIREEKRSKQILICNGEWEKFRESLLLGLNTSHHDVTYAKIESAIKEASKKVMKIKKRKDQDHIFGYNKDIQREISARRRACSNWKKEDNIERKKLLEEEYRKQKEKVNDMMDAAEAEEIKKIIDKESKEGLDFWKTMKRLKKKVEPTTKIRKDNGEITEDIDEILEEKKKYFCNLYSKPAQTKKEMETESIILNNLKKAFKSGKELEMNKHISIGELEKSIDASKEGAPGPDIITNKMLKEGKDVIKEDLCNIFNNIKEKKEEFPISWELGDIISFFKGKGDPFDMIFQRGITLTSCVLKILENVIGRRIEPEIKKNSTPLQGGGKTDESPEEYLFVIQTIIDLNKLRNRPSKLIITDVEKAFDQAWRLGVFDNLANKRGIKGEILELVWKINSNVRARIKEDIKTHSEEFTAEESIRQGGGLSAILYGQHVSSVVEDLEEEKMGPKIGGIHVPALAWQDDVTLIPNNKEEEYRMIDNFERSTEKNRIKLAIKKKTKALNIGGEDLEPTVMKGEIVKETDNAMILGYTFNSKGNPETHLSNRETETISMMANMGLSIQENNMDRIYTQSLLILHKKCFVQKILHGLAGIPMQAKSLEQLELIDRKVLRNFLGLPSCTPKISLYNELGVIPIKLNLWKRKLGMWWRLSQDKANVLMKECRREQINSGLPWIVQLNEIACQLKIDLDNAKTMTKYSWKTEIKKKIRIEAQKLLETEIEGLKGYRENIKDEIIVGKKKRYVSLTQKKAKVWFRMRANIIDPAPRRPYNPSSIWKCKFCDAEEQSTKHYIKMCRGIKQEIFREINRDDVYQIIQTLECSEYTFNQVTQILTKIYVLVTA